MLASKISARFVVLTGLVTMMLSSLAQATEFADSGPRKFKALQLISQSYSPKVSAKRISLSHKGDCRTAEYNVIGQDPIDGRNRAVKVRVHRPFGTSPVERAVIVIPSIIGTTTLESVYALDICKRGLWSLVVEGIERDNPVQLALSSYDKAALRKLAAIRHITEFLYAQGVRDIGVLGTSQGALVASLALGLEAKIKTAALIAGGGDLAEIVVDSMETSQAALRAQRMQRFGYGSRTEYLRALRHQISINNMDFVGFTGSKPVWMSVVTDDTVVPTRTQLDLKKALQPVEVVEYSGDHIAGILKTFMFSKGSVIEFFARTL